MASKEDIKEFENAMRAGGLDPNNKDVRRRFHASISGEGLRYKEIVERAKDFKKMLENESGVGGGG